MPPTQLVQKIRRAMPAPESRRALLGHLRDSHDALEAEGEESTAATLDRVIERLEGARRRVDGGPLRACDKTPG